MNKNLSFLLVALLAAASAYCDGMKIKNWRHQKNTAQAKFDRDNVLIVKDAKVNNRGAAPANSLAAAIAEKNLKITWQPKWRYYGAGGPWLPAAVLSPDSSALAIVETLGEAEGPFGSRIVVINNYNHQIVKLIELPDKHLLKICFVPGSNLLACIRKRPAEADEDIKPKQNIILLNLKSGIVVEESPDFQSALSSICVSPNGKNLLIKRIDNKNIYILPVENMAAPQVVFNASFPGGLLACFANEHTLVNVGKSQINLFDFELETSKPIKIIPLSMSGLPDKIVMGNPDNKAFALLQSGVQACFVQNRRVFDIPEAAGNALAWNPHQKNLILAMLKKNAIQFYQPPDFNNPQSKFFPLKERPRTRGDITGIFPLSNDKLLLLDSRGNLMLMKKSRRRWRKSLLIESMK